MADPAHILRWMAARLDSRDAEALARDLVALLHKDPGVTHARVFVSEREVIGASEPSIPAAEIEIVEGPVRVVIGGSPGEEALSAAVAGALCLQRAAVSGADEPKRQIIHDLRGALAVIAGHCEMLEAGVWGDLSPEQVRSAKAMARQAERMRGLIERLRDV